MNTPAAQIREALNAVYSGREGTCSYVLDGYGRTDALAALDALEQERDDLLRRLQRRVNDCYCGEEDDGTWCAWCATDSSVLVAARVLAGRDTG